MVRESLFRLSTRNRTLRLKKNKDFKERRKWNSAPRGVNRKHTPGASERKSQKTFGRVERRDQGPPTPEEVEGEIENRQPALSKNWGGNF